MRNFTGRNNSPRMKSELPRFPKTDKRLLGTWKSDCRRTFEDWSWSKKLSPKKKKRFQSLFGKLEVTYTRHKIILRLRQHQCEQSQRYTVVAADEASVAIVQFGRLKIKNRRKYDPENLKIAEELFPSKPTIQHIHFEKKHYWISLGNGRNCEFFRKVASNK